MPRMVLTLAIITGNGGEVVTPLSLLCVIGCKVTVWSLNNCIGATFQCHSKAALLWFLSTGFVTALNLPYKESLDTVNRPLI